MARPCSATKKNAYKGGLMFCVKLVTILNFDLMKPKRDLSSIDFVPKHRYYLKG